MWDNYSDTWVAVDALKREFPNCSQVGLPQKDKFVGIFYFIWFDYHGNNKPFDISKIVAQDLDVMQKPDSPLWGAEHAPHYWGEPLFGYYLSDDAYVLRKHAQLLSDAGVDTLIFDTSNELTYKDNYTKLLEVFTDVRRNGGKTPQIVFLTPFSMGPYAYADCGKVVRKLYNELYGSGLYSDLWFRWKGKPLILADPEKVDSDLRDFFTFRNPQPSYFEGPTGPNQWGWLESYPQHIFYNSEGKTEEMTVGVAQNAKEGMTGCMSEPGAQGRSFHKGKLPEPPYPTAVGCNFAEQWERALKIDPEFIFITGWNEWMGGRFGQIDSEKQSDGVKQIFKRVAQPVMFVDTYNQEFSRDIEPMKGGYGDNYYYQMVSYIRRFKGVRKLSPAGPQKTIVIDGEFSDWDDVTPEFRDDIGDAFCRDYPGWGSIGQYVNNSGRNDFILLKIARDPVNIYFYAQTKEAITPCINHNWMMLFINIDCKYDKGWEGYDFIVNRRVIDESTTMLEASMGGWNWKEVAEIKYQVIENEMELAIPRNLIGLDDLSKTLKIDFKWADNIQESGDIIEFILNGDSAPNGRFNYRFME